MPAVLKCPCHGIISDGTSGNLLFPVRITEKQAGRITVNYGWTAEDSDIRKFPGIIYVQIVTVPLYNKWLAE